MNAIAEIIYSIERNGMIFEELDVALDKHRSNIIRHLVLSRRLIATLDRNDLTELEIARAAFQIIEVEDAIALWVTQERYHSLQPMAHFDPNLAAGHDLGDTGRSHLHVDAAWQIHPVSLGLRARVQVLNLVLCQGHMRLCVTKRKLAKLTSWHRASWIQHQMARAVMERDGLSWVPDGECLGRLFAEDE